MVRYKDHAVCFARCVYQISRNHHGPGKERFRWSERGRLTWDLTGVPGARGRYLDNVRINHLIFFDNIIERIDATNFCLLNVSVSVVVLELYTNRHLCGEWSLYGVTIRVLLRRTNQQTSYRDH
jgi:hypothetical protein